MIRTMIIGAIAKPSGPQLSVIDSYSESNKDSERWLYSGYREKVGQCFTTTEVQVFNSAKFYLRKTGSPTGSAYVKLYAATGTVGSTAVPTGSPLATSDAFDVSTLTTSFQLLNFDFLSAYTGVSGDYFIVFEYAGGDSNNRVDLGSDASSPSHSGNEASYNGSTWSAGSEDCCFYLYGNTASEIELDSYSESNQNTYARLNSSNSEGAGEAFTLAESKIISKVKFYLKKTGSASGTGYAKLYAATGTVGSSGLPTGSALATASVSASAVGTDFELVELTFSSPYVAAAGDYFIAFEYASGDSSNYLDFGVDTTSPTYSGNFAYKPTGGSWTASSSNDAIFYLYGYAA